MKHYVVDAFADSLFHGNQAAVCVMENWIPDCVMMNIAKENNFSETAFAVKEGDAYHLRWFTPGGEIDFCGHATLGTTFVLFQFYEKDAEEIHFDTKVGKLSVQRRGDMYGMDLDGQMNGLAAYSEYCSKMSKDDKIKFFQKLCHTMSRFDDRCEK